MQERQEKQFMETERIPKLLARFAAPALIGMLASALYNIVDRIFVGQTVGREGIAAIALAFPCMLFFMSASFLVGIGAASRVSILLGEKRRRRAEQTLGNAFLAALVLSGLLWGCGRILFRPILLLSGTSESLYPLAASYLSVILYGVVFSVMSFSLSCQIRAAGSPVYAMGSQIVGALVNIGLDWWLVVHKGMGVQGAAVATVISQALSFVWTMSYFYTPRAVLRLRLAFILLPNTATMRRIFAVGFPSCLVNLNFVFIHGIITNTVSSYGGDLAVSATGIFTSLDSLLFMPAIAIAEACQPLVGYNYGAQKIDRVVATVKTGMLAATVFYLVSFAIIMAGAEYLVLMFNREDRELIALAAHAVRLGNIGIPLMGISVVNTSFLQGLGMGKEGLMLAAVRFCLFLWVPLLLLPRYFGVYGAWGSFPVSDILGSAVSGIYAIHVVRKLRNSRPLPDGVI